MPITVAKELIGGINEAIPDIRNNSRLLYVKKLRERRVGPGTPTWMLRVNNTGLAPLTSGLQNSPVIGQGTYRQMEAGAVITRHMKRFTEDEMAKLLSPDKVFRLPALEHIATELADSIQRVYETMEFVAFRAFVLGTLRYVLNDSISRVSVDMTFPVKALGYADCPTGVAWSDTTNAKIVTDMNWLLRNFTNRAGRKPEAIRMTTDTWYSIRDNKEVRDVFGSYLRTSGAKQADVERGTVTPGLVAQACDWPPFEIYDERTFVSGTCTNSESEGSNIVVEMKEGTWGFSIGDKVLCNYAVTANGIDDWAFESTITAINPGVSITFTIPAGKSLAAGNTIATWSTFMPNGYIQFVLDETENEWILPPFGIDYSGSTIQVMHLYGPQVDMFNIGYEPKLAVGRRVWHEFGLLFGNPNKHMSCKVF